MRCHICDRILDKIVIDQRDGKIKPCSGCLEAVAVAEYERTLEELEEERVTDLQISNGDPEQTDDEGLGVGVGGASVPSRPH